jgi:hypothetical protein
MTELLYSPKIRPEHLTRKAIVYLRQSSEKQVRQNKESQRLQLDLAERMRGLGWKEIEIVGSDLGSRAVQKLHPVYTVGSLVGLAIACTDANGLRSILISRHLHCWMDEPASAPRYPVRDLIGFFIWCVSFLAARLFGATNATDCSPAGRWNGSRTQMCCKGMRRPN